MVPDRPVLDDPGFQPLCGYVLGSSDEISEELWKLEMSGENFDALEYEDFALWIRLGRMLRMFKDDDI